MGLPKIITDLRAGILKGGVSEEIIKFFGAVRISFAFYNTIEDAYKAVVAIKDLSNLKKPRKKQSIKNKDKA
jgi:selenocysteine lyase/cysteine desulfurase